MHDARYRPLVDYVARKGGLRLSMHGGLRDQIVEAIVEMDADVLLVEGARSGMRILDVLRRSAYPGDVGPGVYDVHSPRVPSPEEIEALLREAGRVLPADRLWVNPDCGLKTRRWDEVRPALAAMVAAARRLRAERDEPVAAPRHAKKGS